ncbi:MAG TPA: hypothetical protein GX404_00325 [Syntrophomonadaceae bacterium]|jgi:hypothetical protein|nr:hypothetical protein [Syntrophomonadaceae bacterium]
MYVMRYVILFFIALTIAIEGRQLVRDRDWKLIGIVSLLLLIAMAYAINADYRLHILPNVADLISIFEPWAQQFNQYFHLSS